MIGALGGIGGIAQGAVGLAGMLGAFDEDNPETSDLAWDDYWAKMSMSPSLAKNALQSTPWYQSVGGQTFNRALTGAPEETVTGYGWDPASDSYQPYTFKMPAQRGAYDIYGEAVNKLGGINAGAARGAMPEAYSALGRNEAALGSAGDALNWNRGNLQYGWNLLNDAAPMLQDVAARANRELGYGASLSPAVRRELIQAGLSNPALSSFGAQPRDAYAAYANLGTAAENRQRQRWSDAAAASQGLTGLAGQYGDLGGRYGALSSGLQSLGGQYGDVATSYFNLAQPGLAQTLNLGGNLMASGLNAGMQSTPGWWDPFNANTGSLNQMAGQMGFQQSQINQGIRVGGAKQVANSFSSMGNMLGGLGGGGSAGASASPSTGYGNTLYNMYYGGG